MNDSISEETSKRIESLRFILMVLVVLQHSGDGWGRNISGCVSWVHTFIIKGVVQANVPLFFIFSGYLMNIKGHPYPVILKKRFRSLFVPYILWFVLYAILFVLLIRLPKLNVLVPNIYKWDLKIWAKEILGYGLFFNFPLIPQFWFLRDLMIFTIIFPVLKFFVNKDNRFSVPFLFAAVLCFWYFSGYIIKHTINPFPIFFFTIGIYFAEYKIDFFKACDKIKWFEIIVLFVLFICLEKFNGKKFFAIRDCTRIASSIIWIKLSAYFIASPKCFEVLKKLNPYSFFLYASHQPLVLNAILKVAKKFIPTQGIWVLIIIFASCVVCIAFCVAIGIGLKKLFPKTFSLFCGGR